MPELTRREMVNAVERNSRWSLSTERRASLTGYQMWWRHFGSSQWQQHSGSLHHSPVWATGSKTIRLPTRHLIAINNNRNKHNNNNNLIIKRIIIRAITIAYLGPSAVWHLNTKNAFTVGVEWLEAQASHLAASGDVRQKVSVRNALPWLQQVNINVSRAKGWRDKSDRFKLDTHGPLQDGKSLFEQIFVITSKIRKDFALILKMSKDSQNYSAEIKNSAATFPSEHNCKMEFLCVDNIGM